MINYEILDTDVLIVGGGGAGTRAAIAAAEAGARVTVLVKGQVAHSGATPMAGASFQAAIGAWEPEDTPQIAFEDACREGGYLGDENLIKALVEDAPTRAMEVERYGLKLTKEQGRYLQVMHPGQSYARNLVMRGCGYGMVFNLRRELLRHSAIRTMEDVVVRRLLKDGDRVAGALVLDLRTSSVLAVQSRSVVLATGGYHALYASNDCEPGVTGDGQAMAMNIGATLVDLEMVLYYPTCLTWPDEVSGTSVQYEGLLGPRYLAGKMLNAEGKEFLPESGGAAKLPARDVLMKAMFQEIEAGRGSPRGGVYIDITNTSHSREEAFALLRKLDSVPYNSLRDLGVDVTEDLIEVRPAVHYCLGGVRINERAESSVAGLYAAGEVSGNLHGANRISGNGIAETQVFGRRAGQYAAEHARSATGPHLDDAEVRTQMAQMTEYLEPKEDSIRPSQVKQKLQAMMDREMGHRRNAESMAAALEEVRRLRDEELPRVQAVAIPKYNYEWQEAMELENMLDVAEAVVLSADLRKESRGHHFRTDFPESSEAWLKHTTIQRRTDGNMDLDSPLVTRLGTAVPQETIRE